MPSAPDRLEAIDALRGVAILGVLLVHTGQSVPAFLGKSLTAAGAFGVVLFFIASAFTLLASHRRRSSEPFPITAFFIRRVFRIVPLFWAGIFFYYLIYGAWNRGWAEGSLSWFHFGTTALLLHGRHPDTINIVVPGGWSIAVEFGFYLLAPIAFAMISTWRKAVFAYVVALVGALAFNSAVRHGHWIGHLFPQVAPWRQASFTYLWLPFHLPTFLLGFVGFYLVPEYAKLTPRVRQTAFVAICAALLACALWLPFQIGDFVFPLLLAAFVVALVADPIRMFVNRAMCALGVVSFSAYITHFAALKVAEKAAARFAWPLPEFQFAAIFLTTLVLTVGASFLTYRLIEKPGIALGRRIIRGLRERSEASSIARAV